MSDPDPDLAEIQAGIDELRAGRQRNEYHSDLACANRRIVFLESEIAKYRNHLAKVERELTAAQRTIGVQRVLIAALLPVSGAPE